MLLWRLELRIRQSEHSVRWQRLLPANWSIALPFLWFVVKTPHGMKVEIGIRAGNLPGYIRLPFCWDKGAVPAASLGF